MLNSRRGAAVALVILAVVVVYAVYFISVENQKKLGEMLSSTMKRFAYVSNRGKEGGGGGAAGGGAAAGDSLPPLSEFENVKDTSKLAEFRKEIKISVLPNKETMQNMSMRQLGRILLQHLDNVDLHCTNILRMGVVGDGGWEVCDDVRWRPMQNCLVYSFGINNEFSFDDRVAATYDCHVFSFDPSMKAETHNRSDRVHFYKWGISGKDEVRGNGWHVYTVKTIRQKLGHSKRPIDVFKMDVESSEWPSIPNMAATGQLREIRQLLVEFHLSSFSKPDLINKLLVLRDIQQAGFRKFLSHKNPACRRNWDQYPGTISSCYEVYFVNIHFPNPH